MSCHVGKRRMIIIIGYAMRCETCQSIKYFFVPIREPMVTNKRTYSLTRTIKIAFGNIFRHYWSFRFLQIRLIMRIENKVQSAQEVTYKFQYISSNTRIRQNVKHGVS